MGAVLDKVSPANQVPLVARHYGTIPFNRATCCTEDGLI